MSTLTSPRPRVKPVRTLAVLHPVTANGGCVRITEGKVAESYCVERTTSDFGIATHWVKDGDDTHPG